MLVLGGSPPSEEMLAWRFEDADHAVAVDSGILAFREAGFEPELLIGDMDSCGLDETLQQESAYRVVNGLKKTRLLVWLSLINITEPTRLGMIAYDVYCFKKK